jgi:hypothetical protein
MFLDFSAQAFVVLKHYFGGYLFGDSSDSIQLEAILPLFEIFLIS